MNFEFQPTGGIIPHAQYGTVKLLRYITKADYALMGRNTKESWSKFIHLFLTYCIILILGAEFAFAIFIIYYLIEEILEIRNMKLEYFQTFWNCMDLFVILVSWTQNTLFWVL